MKAKTLAAHKMNYASQDASNGVISIKILLGQHEGKDEYFAAIGCGEDDWVLANGRRLRFEEASFFFQNINTLKERWECRIS